MNILTNIKSKTKALCMKAGQWKDKAFLALCGITGAIVAATPAKATDIDDLFTAGDLSGLSANIKAYFLIGVTITIMFIGYRYFKKAGNRV